MSLMKKLKKLVENDKKMLKQIRRLALNGITVLLNASPTASARLGQNDINQSNPHPALRATFSLGEGNSPLPRRGNRKVAFTLAEVLITIGIIGVVAAMTIPTLMHNIQAKEFESKFKKANSMVAQLARMIQNDDISLDNNDYNTAGAFNDIITKYVSGAIYCGKSTEDKYSKGCYNPYYTKSGQVSKRYKTFANNKIAATNIIDDGSYFLKDGKNLYLESNFNRVYISIDLNGFDKGPNRWGYDIFMWQLKDYTFIPMGLNNTDFPSGTYCSKTSDSTSNGFGCTALAANNPDYFKNLK